MIGTESVFSLLFAHGTDNNPHRIMPLSVEWLRSARSLPVSMREPDRIAQRVQFIFALAHALLHLRLVLAAPLERRSIQVRHKGIRVGIDEDIACLPPYDAFNERPQPLVFARKLQVWPHLCRRIPLPHCRNIASDHHRVRLAFECPRLDGCIQRIGEAVEKEPRQLWISDAGANLYQILLDNFGTEATVCRLRTLPGRIPCEAGGSSRHAGKKRRQRGHSSTLQQLSSRKPLN